MRLVSICMRLATDDAMTLGCNPPSSSGFERSRGSPFMTQKIRCHHCDDVIGVYEPMIVVHSGEVRETSRAADPTLNTEAGEHYHRRCYLERFDPEVD